MRKKWLLFFILILFIVLSCENKNEKILFNYKVMLKKSNGETIPVTIGRSIEIEGVVDNKGEFFYYSSDKEMGNYDIYLRSLEDVKTVRLTSHSSKDYSPAISPDGKKLLFVSEREDPEGDIYVYSINPEKTLENSKSSIDKSAKNLTISLDEDGVVKSFKDSGPKWSSDGDYIVFSSKRDGIENIWIMEDDGDNLKKITEKGGVKPSFSKSGKKIIFLSYRNKMDGEIYLVDVETKEEEKINVGNGIIFNPTFGKTENEIFYSIIDEDTNKDGNIDLRDNSVICYYDFKKKIGYRLTSYSVSSFSPYWFNLRSKGVVLYSEQWGNNIDVKVIYDSGVIPDESTAKNQYRLALNFANKKEKSLLAYEKVVWNYYGENNFESNYYVTKALIQLIDGYGKSSRNGIDAFNKLKKLSNKKNQFVNFEIEMLNANDNKKRNLVFLKYDHKFKSIKLSKIKKMHPFYLEEKARYLLQSKKTKRALIISKNLLRDYPKYVRKKDVTYLISKIENKKNIIISNADFYMINKGSAKEIAIVKKNILKRIFGIKNKIKRLSLLEEEREKYRKNIKILPMLNYSIGKTYLQLKNEKLFLKNMLNSQKEVKSDDIINYLVNTVLSDYFIKKGNLKNGEKFTFTAVKNYLDSWNQNGVSNRILWLINYYEKKGEEFTLSGKNNKALKLYSRYKVLMVHLKNKKRYKKIYKEYGPIAHIRYIDTVISVEGKKGLKKIKKMYMNHLSKARMDFDIAYIFGLAYIDTKLGLQQEKKKESLDVEEKIGLEGLTFYFSEAIQYIKWVQFLDESFIDSYLLKSWIYQYLDLKRIEQGDAADKIISKLFPAHLLEKNLIFLDKALSINNALSKNKEGKIHLNLGNSYSILKNYPRAMYHYNKVSELSEGFNSKIEEAIFHFHNAYSLWQNGFILKATNEMKVAYNIYLITYSNNKSKEVISKKIVLSKYFAFFSRMKKDYITAIDWYEKILDYSKQFGIKIDKSRYYQEIAFCYEATGNYNKALNYLQKAKRTLIKDKKLARTYQFKWKWFNLFSFKFFDLGSSSAVIGENKIYTSLNTKEKKLYNVSLFESISKKNRNYGEVVKYLNQKINLLHNATTVPEQQTLIRAYNNLGYYLFNSRKYKKAIIAYEKSWEEALDTENNLEAILSSILNISKIYAYMIDYDISFEKDKLKEISNFLERIEEFKSEYEEQSYDLKYAYFKKEKDVAGLELTEEDISEIKKDIKEEVLEKYYKINISKGILEFYRAEIILKKIKKEDIDEPMDLYVENKKIFNIYYKSIVALNNATKQAKVVNNLRMIIKLLLNSGIGYTRIGDFALADRKYLQAVKIAEKLGNKELLLKTYESIGAFLFNYGINLYHDTYLNHSNQYYKKAIDIVEENPLNYSSSLERINRLYDQYIRLLVKTKKFEQAFDYSEKGYAVSRIILVQKISPKFYNNFDNKNYYDYLKLTMNSQKSDLRKSEKLYNTVYKKSPILASFLKYKKPKFLENNFVAYKFIEVDGDLYGWKFQKGKLKSRKFEKIDSENIKLFMNDKEKRRFVIFNKTISKNIKNQSIDLSELPNFTFVTSLDRISKYLSMRRKPIRTIFSYEEDFSDSIDLIELNLFCDEYEEEKKIDYGKYSLFIDFEESKSMELEEIFASKNLNSQLFIKNYSQANYYDMILFVEAALYRDVNNVLFAKNIDFEKGEKLINYFSKSNYFASENFLHGFESSFSFGIEGRNPKKEKNKIFNKSKFDQLIRIAKYDDARNLLNNWDRNQDVINSENYKYSNLLLSIAETDNENIDKIIDEYDDIFDEKIHYLKIKIFLFLSRGQVDEAESLIEDIENIDDFELSIYKDIITYVKLGKFDNKNYLLNTNAKNEIGLDRILILFSQYLTLYGDESLAEKILSNVYISSPLTEREILFYYYITGKKLNDNNSFVNRKIEKFYNGYKLKNILEYLEELKEDPTYCYGVLNYLKKVEKNNLKHSVKNFDVNLILENGKNNNGLEKLILYKSLGIKFDKINSYKKSLKYYLLSKEILSDYEFPKYESILNFLQAKTYLNMKDYDSANNLFDDLDFVENDKWYISSKLHMIRSLMESNEIEDAEIGLDEIENKIVKNSEYSFYFYLLRNRLLILKNQKKEEAKQNADTFYGKILSNLKNPKNEKVKQNINILYGKILLDLKSQKFQIKTNYMKQLFSTVSDYYINYKIDQKRFEEALYYQQTSKLILESNLNEKNIPLIELKKYDILFSLKDVQSSIKKDQLVVNISRNKDDLYIWLIGNKFKLTKILKKAALKLKDIDSKYLEVKSNLKPVFLISKELDTIFSPLKKYLKNYKELIFVLDKFSSKIPVEIIGSTQFLDERYDISFMPDITTVLNEANFNVKNVVLKGSVENYIYKKVEKIAINESGLMISKNEKISNNIYHNFDKFSFFSENNYFYFDSKKFEFLPSYAKGFIYFSDSEIGFDKCNYVNLKYHRDGILGILYGFTTIKDLNNGIFAQVYYDSIAKGINPIRASNIARAKIRRSKRFSHPAFWSSYRFYRNGL